MEYRTKSGRVLTDADIEALAEEAERGYDMENPRRATWDNVRKMLDEGVEMLYVHDERGRSIALIIPNPGWWQTHLPDAPPEHFSHDHVYPWGEPS